MRRAAVAVILMLMVSAPCAALIYIQASGGGGGISEDFSSCANFTSFLQTVSCSGGVAVGTAWEYSIAYHATAYSGQGQWVQADLYYTGSGSTDSPILGVRGTTSARGIEVYFSGGTIYAYNRSDAHSIGSYNGSYGDGTYTVKLQISTGDLVKVWVDGTERISETDWSTPTGTRLHIGLDRDSSNHAVTVDNLTAGDL